MAGDADLLAEFAAPPQRTRCFVCGALLEMGEEQHAKMQAALKAPISALRVATVVTGWGYHVSPDSVERHRRNHG